MHGLPTWEHLPASEFREAARKDILKHYSATTHFEDVGIVRVEKIKEGLDGDEEKSLFKAIDERGREWWGRKVVIVSGVKDVMVDIEGYKECWVSGM